MSSISLPVEQNATTQAPQMSPLRKWSMLVVLSLALAVIVLDTTILNVALSSIIRDLHTNIQSIQWVITGYSLTLAALTITGGRMGDIFGRKRMFVLGAFLFAIGSFLASVSTNVGVLIAGESIIEGIGAALMMPATTSLLIANFAGRERAIAFGIWGGIAGASAALGPILGGYLATNYDWRWGFRINLIIVAALIIGSFLIPESRDKKEKPEIDWLGVILSATGMLSLVFGVIESTRYGWLKAKEAFVLFDHVITLPGSLSVVPVFVGLGAVILGLFLLWEKIHEERGHTPLVSIGLFKNRTFTSGVATTTIMSLGQTGLIFCIPVFLQSVRGLDAFHTGIALLPMSLSLLIVAPLSAALSKKIAPKTLIVLGLLINTLAYLLLYAALTVDTTTADLIPGLATFGIGMGLVMSQISNITLSAVEPHQAGEASGVNNTLRQVGSTLGSTIIGTILVGSLGTHLLAGLTASTKIPDAVKPQIAEALTSESSDIEFGGGPALGADIPKEISEEIVFLGHQATVDAAKETFLFSTLFAFIGFLVALFFLPGKKKEKKQIVEPTAPVTVKIAPRYKLDTEMIAEIIAVDTKERKNGNAGLGDALRALLDAKEAGTTTHDHRMLWARRLWDAGIGQALGFSSFKEYAASIPEIPGALLTHNGDFPHLIYVEKRLAGAEACEAFGVALKGNENTSRIPSLTEKGESYWTRVHDGSRYTGKNVAEATRAFTTPGEASCGVHEGLSLMLLMPEVTDGKYLDLPGTPHEGFAANTACLGKWNGKTELRWRWSDHTDPSCATLSQVRG